MILLSCICFVFVCMSSDVFSASVHLPTSLNVTCDVDYRGLILFNINLPKEYDSFEKPKFLYKNENMKKWVEQIDCRFSSTDRKKTLICSMSVFGNNRRNDKYFDTYYFKVVMLIDGQEYAIENFTLSGSNNQMLTPWKYYRKLAYCTDSYGVKYIATNSTIDKVFVEWILQPIDADTPLFTSRITFEGEKQQKETISIDKSSVCRGDLCSYQFSDLETCSRYHVCIETDDLDNKNTRKTCKNVHTYCNGENDIEEDYLEWKDALLCICGFVMLIVCSFVLWALCRKQSKNTDPIFNEVIDQDDLLHPASADEHKAKYDQMRKENQSQYMYMEEISDGVIFIKS